MDRQYRISGNTDGQDPHLAPVSTVHVPENALAAVYQI